MQKRKIWFLFSGSLLLASLLALIFWGINFGIDFTGGSLLEIRFKNEFPSTEEARLLIIESKLIENASVQTTGEKGIILRFKTIDEETHQKILKVLKDKYNDNVYEEKFTSVGPSIGEELKKKTLIAIVLAVIGIVVYIAYTFRRVSKPVSSWKYGLIANIALLHDVFITIGAFSILGKFYGIEINAPFIAAILTILGYSVNDTIVVFDRIRENLLKYYKGSLIDVIDKSINETIVRSINTSMTVILVLFAILLFGGSTIRDFTLALIIGVTVGTYSSIFIASPLLIVFDNWSRKERVK